MLRKLFGNERYFAATGLLVAMSLLVTFPAMLLDTREFQGSSIWTKPIKFQASLAIYLMTLAFFARYLPAGLTSRPSYKAFSTAVVLAVFAELIWIGGAAMFGAASHFNTDPLMALIYPVMGVVAITITSASLVYGVAIWRDPTPEISKVLRLSISFGLILTFVMTIGVAGTMASQTSHLVGSPTYGTRVPLMGWSREVGDLRVAHFFATHAMHVLPAVGLACWGVRSEKLAMSIVLIACLAYVLIVGSTFFQALAGQPIFPG